ncbi:MAG: LysR substrate-binding domain-containing protein [Eisenbergiella sp.]
MSEPKSCSSQVFNEKHPGVSICLFEGNTDEVEEALHSGTVDVSIGFLPKDTAQIISATTKNTLWLLFQMS